MNNRIVELKVGEISAVGGAGIVSAAQAVWENKYVRGTLEIIGGTLEVIGTASVVFLGYALFKGNLSDAFKVVRVGLVEAAKKSG